MKQKYTLVIWVSLFCLSIFGQKSINLPITKQPQQTSTQVSYNQQETILQLQAENEAIQKQLDKMEKELELYREDIRAKEANINEALSQWLTIMGIMMAVIGIAIPMILNYRNEKSMEKMLEDVKKQASSAETQAKEATTQATQAKNSVTEIEDLKKHVTAIEEKIKQDTAAAEKAANEARASQLFTQAMNEKEPLKAIELYNKAIEQKSDFYEAYNNRGFFKDKINELTGALADYDKAIELKPEDASAYNNRACTLIKIRELDRALKDANTAIKKNNKLPHAYDTRGQIYMALEKNEEALKDFNHALSLYANYVEALENRAKCYRKLEKAEQDPRKKEDLIAKAKADEKKAELLKKGDKV